MSIQDEALEKLNRAVDGYDADHAELIDIRLGADGTEYPSAGDAVRGQISAMTADSTSVAFRGGYFGASGGSYNSTILTAITTVDAVDPEVIRISANTGYKLRLQAWDAGIYAGIWNGTKFVKSNPNYFMTNIDFAGFVKQYPTYLFHIALFRTDGANIDVSESVNAIFQYPYGVLMEKTALTRYPTKYGGTSIKPQRHGMKIFNGDTALPSKPSGTSSRQGMDIYNDRLFVLANNNQMSVINFKTLAKIADLSISCDHGNSCQFAGSVASGDTYPHLFCFGYTTNKVYENAITDNATTLIKTYVLPITGYRLSGGYDAYTNQFRTIHYKADASDNPENNGCVVSVWDLNSLIDNGDDTFTPELIRSYEVPFLPVIQDCKCHGFWLYVLSGRGGSTTYKETWLSVYDDCGLVNRVRIASSGNEPEGLIIVDTALGTKVYYASNQLFEISFE